MSSKRQRVVAFISGGGSNMLALVQASAEADYPAEIIAVFSDKPDAGGIAKAKALGIPTHVFERKAFASKAEHEAAIRESLGAIGPDLICLAGYMRLLSADFIRAYEGRILNIHPSLLPLFPGLHTHQRALDAGMKVAGCTVHFVTEGMDEGPVIAQSVVPVLIDDTAETLAARVLTVEHKTYAAALKLVASGSVSMRADGSVERLSSETDADARLISA